MATLLRSFDDPWLQLLYQGVLGIYWVGLDGVPWRHGVDHSFCIQSITMIHCELQSRNIKYSTQCVYLEDRFGQTLPGTATVCMCICGDTHSTGNDAVLNYACAAIPHEARPALQNSRASSAGKV